MKINKKLKSDLLIEEYTNKLFRRLFKANKVVHITNTLANRNKVRRTSIIIQHITRYLFNFKDPLQIEIIIDFCERTEEKEHLKFFRTLLLKIKDERGDYD